MKEYLKNNFFKIAWLLLGIGIVVELASINGNISSIDCSYELSEIKTSVDNVADKVDSVATEVNSVESSINFSSGR
jgi:hypothetical protein